MKIKKYQASSMPEAMKLIRNELGNDAVILNSRVVQTGGFLGFFKKRMIEVIAALDEKPVESFSTARSGFQIPDELPPKETHSLSIHKVDKIDENGNEEWRKEISELRSLLNTVVDGHANEGIPLPKHIQELKRVLQRQGIDHKVINDVMKSALESWFAESGNKSEIEVFQWAKKYLTEQISYLPFGGISFTKKYINVVGPTGVGKTTTLAKIAAHCLLKYKKKIAFITTDTYRIAAIEQLKTYANILNIPIEVCYNLADFQKATLLFESYDLVFIDTAGRNFRNHQYVEDLKNIIDFGKDLETYLVLSLTAKQMDMEEIYQQFSTIEIDKIIFTKSDETSSFGAMYNVIHSWKKAAAYITNGQNVPDDIVTATPENVIDYIIGVDKNG
jgi:flagellar biosynthesis protein FlhF